MGKVFFTVMDLDLTHCVQLTLRGFTFSCGNVMMKQHHMNNLFTMSYVGVIQQPSP